MQYIISYISDGLGNQMFQYALGRRLSVERKVPLYLDIRWFENIEKRFTSRRFLLDNLNICYRRAPSSLITKIENPNLPIGVRKLHYLYHNILPYYKRRLVREQGVNFDENILKCPSKVLLKGFWQSEKYFLNIRPILLREFTPKQIPKFIQRLENQITKQYTSVAVHIRLGDYKNENSQHILLNSDYYVKAISELKKKLMLPAHFFIFSDEPEKAAKIIDTENTFIIMPCHEEHPEWDLWLMRQCRHFIISNSTFSWWGAWLSENLDKIVIAPDRRHKNPTLDSKDYLPSSWIKVPVSL